MMNNRGEWSEATRSVAKEQNAMKKDTKEERKQDQDIIEKLELKALHFKIQNGVKQIPNYINNLLLHCLKKYQN